MRTRLTSIALGCTLFASLTALAQAPSKPDNATAQCKDGSYWTGATKSGACRGHQGIQTWYADAARTPQPPPAARPTTPPPPPTAMARTPPSKPSPTAAPGGGPGLVWVNTSTKVYHCYGDRNYGTTKAGKYMSEADAKTMGAKPSRGQQCSK
jgi:Protein of unknown function (DUF3761)